MKGMLHGSAQHYFFVASEVLEGGFGCLFQSESQDFLCTVLGEFEVAADGGNKVPSDLPIESLSRSK